MERRTCLAASCSARGQFVPLPMRGSANLALPAPPAKRSEPIASQILHLGPPTSEAKIGPAGTSVMLRGLEIGYRGLMLRWISLTSAWLGAAKAKALQPVRCQGTPGAHLLPGDAQPCVDRRM